MMTEAEAIVNKALETDATTRPPQPLPENTDDPQQYLDWAGHKAEMGSLREIRFGAHIHTTDEDVLRENAKESGIDIDDPVEIGNQLSHDYGQIEHNVLRLLANVGLTVSDEGHDSYGARACSVWIRDDISTAHNGQFGLGLLKRILEAADMDWPATTIGNFDSFFPSGTTLAYEGVSDYGKQLIDVTVEFTGVDVLKEWSAVNIIEGIDVDNPEASVIRAALFKRATERVPDKEYAYESAEPIPDADDPADALQSFIQTTIMSEFTRLGFKPYPAGRLTATVFGEEKVPVKWGKGYKAPNGLNHALLIDISPVYACQDTSKAVTYDVRIRNYHPVYKEWSTHAFSFFPKSAVFLFAAIRDADNVMQQTTADSLSLEQEFNALNKVGDHYSQWAPAEYRK